MAFVSHYRGFLINHLPVYVAAAISLGLSQWSKQQDHDKRRCPSSPRGSPDRLHAAPGILSAGSAVLWPAEAAVPRLGLLVVAQVTLLIAAWAALARRLAEAAAWAASVFA